MTMIVGETNTDGSGSAANLTEDNGTVLDLTYFYSGSESDTDTLVSDDITISETNYHYGRISVSVTNTAEWNAQGLKEFYIDSYDNWPFDNYYPRLFISNFVDVHIDIASIGYNYAEAYTITFAIYDAKRGDIDLSALNTDISTYITIVPYSNGASWSNLFTITTGDSVDSVTFTTEGSAYEAGTTKYTEFDVDLGAGDDTFTFDLDAAASTSQTRYVDGGEGDDTLVLDSDSNILDFANFEYIENGSDDAEITLTLSQALLENNSALTITDLDIEFADDYSSITVTETDDDYYNVTVVYDDESYSFTTNEIDSDWILAS